MNDFTKEELEDINYAIETAHLGNSDLRKKVLYMIENYYKPTIDGIIRRLEESKNE